MAGLASDFSSKSISIEVSQEISKIRGATSAGAPKMMNIINYYCDRNNNNNNNRNSYRNSYRNNNNKNKKSFIDNRNIYVLIIYKDSEGISKRLCSLAINQIQFQVVFACALCSDVQFTVNRTIAFLLCIRELFMIL